MQREERLCLEQQQREERDAKMDELILALFAKIAGAHNV
ncbi:hypothetical protein PR003_g20819 [Phytophthora rubi]|uniref:Uncharacterized protein n=1 Tax=Phytophthora rubi TaxID=129364 RepID=A0A6A3JIV5_9STRA|nr:hypothetical protein PR002_g20198 [Phytophthora rubi]KAE9308129.1 hypothetical protein PR003_g20819 [Phytophthora rubi]